MNLGVPEMIFLAMLGLLLFGPRKLPEIGRQLGKAMGEFKRASNEFQAQLNEEVRQLELEADLNSKPEPAALPGVTPRTPPSTVPAPASESDPAGEAQKNTTGELPFNG
jgi:sec-independent protein translocase protein TatB